ncbi:MAG: class I tRNA ligase family protein, partial [Clostridia bacterium]|nr:class I tRNA ligase family protein [Clostridia bacterium]
DTQDTWVSSAHRPFTTHGWPDQTKDLEQFYPTSTLVTGYDIITFWVSRMIFSGLAYTGKKPFSTVLIHGLVRDALGRKMSKSLGNGIDPLEIIDKYGADALRFALATGNAPGNDMRFSDEKIEAARNFTNKIWNAARFVLMNLTIDSFTLPDASALRTEDRWILSEYNRTVRNVGTNLEKFELGIALSHLYDFIWDVFCDWYIELVKPRLNTPGTPDNLAAQQVLTFVLEGTMKLLHPFMPFITEEIWGKLPHAENDETKTVMLAAFPEPDPALDFPEDELRMDRLITAIKAIRNRRAEMNVPPSRKAKLIIATAETDTFTEETFPFFQKLASVSEVTVAKTWQDETAVQLVTDCARLFIPLGDLVDFEKERERLSKEKDNLEKEIARVSAKLANESFVSRAPAAVVDGERAKLAKYTETLKGVLEAISHLG